MVKYSDDGSYKEVWMFGAALYTLIIIPITIYIFKKLSFREKVNHKSNSEKSCKCTLCVRKVANFPVEHISVSLNIIFIGILWIILAIAVAKIYKFGDESSNVFDPFQYLGVSEGASTKEVRKAYRKLAVSKHPDHGGSEKEFIMITRAYKILTDPASRENWELYGNIDGPREMAYGIALPIWLLNDKTPPTLVALYYIVSIFSIPALIVFLWKRFFPSAQESKGADFSISLFFTYLKDNTLILPKRIIILLSICENFTSLSSQTSKDHKFNFRYIEKLLNDMRLTNELTRPNPFQNIYAIEARTLLFAYLKRFSVCNAYLMNYQKSVVRNYRGIIGMILHEYSNMVMYLVYMTQNFEEANRRVNTLENLTILCACIVQGIEPSDSELLQLPHVKNEDIARIQLKKKNVKTISEYAKLTPKLREILICNLTDEEKMDVSTVLDMFPKLSVFIRTRADDESDGITCNSTYFVDLKFKRSMITNLASTDFEKVEEKPKVFVMKKPNRNKKKVKVTEKNQERVHQADLLTDTDQTEFPDPKLIREINHKDDVISEKVPAHCPYFPGILNESWWIYFTYEKPKFSFIPLLVRTECIKDDYVCTLQLSAPETPGIHFCKIHVLSDIYVGVSCIETFKINVVEEKPVDVKQHYDFSSSCDDLCYEVLTQSD